MRVHDRAPHADVPIGRFSTPGPPDVRCGRSVRASRPGAGYDAVVVSDAPDDETIAKLALAAGGRGNLRTETLRALTKEEATKIATELGPWVGSHPLSIRTFLSGTQ